MDYPGSGRASAARAFIQSAGAKLLIIGLNAGTGILTARSLAPAGRGELSAMLLWPVFLSSVLSLGVPSALTYRLRRHPDQASELSGAAVILAVLISVVVAAVGYIGLPHWIPQYAPEVVLFARIFLLNAPISVFIVMGRAALESQGDFTASNLSLIGPPVLTLAGLLLLLWMHTFTPVNAGWCYVLSGWLPAAWMARSYHRALRPRFDQLRNSARLLLSYGIRSYGIDLCGTLSLYVDQALVVRILRPSMMGTYVVALSLSRMLNVFHTAVVMVLFPRAVSRPAPEVLELTGRAVRITTLLTTLCGTGIMLAGPHLLLLLYGPEYRAAANILRILVIEVVLAGATQGDVAGIYGAVAPGGDHYVTGYWSSTKCTADARPGSPVRHCGCGAFAAAFHLRPVCLRGRQLFTVSQTAGSAAVASARRPVVHPQDCIPPTAGTTAQRGWRCGMSLHRPLTIFVPPLLRTVDGSSSPRRRTDCAWIYSPLMRPWSPSLCCCPGGGFTPAPAV